jgi:hypothetical protein
MYARLDGNIRGRAWKAASFAGVGGQSLGACGGRVRLRRNGWVRGADGARWRTRSPVVVVIASMSFHFGNFHNTKGGFMPYGIHGDFAALPLGVVFALQGFDQAVQLAGEARDPKGDLSRAVIIAMAVGGTVYVLLQGHTHIATWRDLIVVIAFSLVILYYAVNSALLSERVKVLVEADKDPLAARA